MRLTVLRPLALTVLLAATMTACVTINIYFPAAAAEKAADRIIDEVWQAREAARPAAGSGDPADEGDEGHGAEGEN